MPQSERLEVLVLGSGTGGKLIAWYMAQSGRRTAVVERHWVGGSCPNIACMPSKNEISNAKVAQLARNAEQYGTVTGSVTVDMATSVGASVRWWNARLRSTCRSIGKAVLN
jgi:pyruvate/2-oxoglutarate dehydrogenase complex dihydrolipoamide dehydrogenase (E3) component